VGGNVPFSDVGPGDHLVLDPSSSATITGGPVPNTTTVLYDYTCYNAAVCDTVYETFNIVPGVTGDGLNQGMTYVTTIQAQVLPPSTPIPGGVKSFTSPPNSNPTRPRWSDLPIPMPDTFITFVPCSTTLLFPWVVNIPGFDTGVVINNTTQDYTNAAALPSSVLIAPPTYPLVVPTPAEQGGCTLYYFPSDESPALYYTRPTALSTGETWALMQSKTPFAGLTGYMMARCQFQYGHGYAAIGQGTSASSLTFAEAYLALVIPDPVVLGAEFGIPRADWNAGYYFDVGENLAH